MTRLRAAGCAALIATAAAALTLLGAELALRRLAPQPLLDDPDAFVPDPLLGARLKPGFSGRVVTTEFSSNWVINAGGYRGPLAGERGPAARRVVALGDSFTFGYGVEEEQSWPRLLEALLDAGHAAKDRVEVLNLGVGGYGTWQETLWLERMAATLHPDLALLAFYAGNDPEDNARTRPCGAGPGDGTAAAAQRPPPLERFKRWAGSRSQLYSLVSQRGDELLVRLGLRRLVYPFELEVLLKDEPSGVAAGWDATRAAFARLAAFSKEARVPVVVVVVPMKHQVSEAFWSRVRSHYEGMSEGAGGWDRDRPQRIVSEILKEAGLPSIDLLAGLREAAEARGDGEVLYWPRDQHWTAEGHAAAARLIAGALPAVAGPALTGTGSE